MRYMVLLLCLLSGCTISPAAPIPDCLPNYIIKVGITTDTVGVFYQKTLWCKLPPKVIENCKGKC